MQDDYFELFGLPARFALSAPELDERYQALQRSVHPDRYVTATPAEKQQAMQWATRINQAYQILRQPLSRAAHLLVLQGIQPDQGAMPEDFLMQQMNWREALQDAAHAQSLTDMETLQAEIQAATRQHFAVLENALEQARWLAAADEVRCLHFLDKLMRDIEQQRIGLARA